MVIYNIRFVWGARDLTAEQLRVASTREAWARWSRDKARRRAAAKEEAALAKKAAKEETVAGRHTSPPREKEVVTVSGAFSRYGNLPAWEGDKEIVTVGL